MCLAVLRLLLKLFFSAPCAMSVSSFVLVLFRMCVFLKCRLCLVLKLSLKIGVSLNGENGAMCIFGSQ